MLIYRPTIISGSGYYSGSFDGDGSRLYNIPSSSYAITASYALNAGGGSKGQKGQPGQTVSAVYTSSIQGQTVTVNHNLDIYFPVYAIYDLAGEEVVPKSFEVINNNTVEIEFGIPFTGSLSIAGGEKGLKGFKGDKGTKGTKGNKGNFGESIYSSSFQGSLVTVSHNLDIQYPVFNIYDSNGEEVLPKSFNVIDKDTVQVDFGIGFTGSISISSGVKGEKGEKGSLNSPYTGSVIIKGNLNVVKSNNSSSFFVSSSGYVGYNTKNPRAIIDINSSSSIVIPVGTTSERPNNPPTGSFRYNKTLAKLEVYTGTSWV